MTKRRPRVLILADSANPESSSVSLIGWSLSQALRRHADVHLVTKSVNAEAIERQGWKQGVDFTPIDPSAVERPIASAARTIQRWTGLGWTFTTALSAITYPNFERLAWRQFGPAIRRGEFDLVHRVVPMSPTTPSPMAAWCRAVGVPFVLGPINGGVPWPREFRAAQHREGEWLSYLRAAHALVPGYRATRRGAAAIIAGSFHTHSEFVAWPDKLFYLPENAIDPNRVRGRRQARTGVPLRVAFVGRLVPYKGADMLLEAASPLAREGKLVLDVIGDGPERSNLERLIEKEGIAPFVQLAGWIADQRQVAPRLAQSDVFAFPSIREFGGGAVLEAMALGLTPVVVDYAGPAELVTDGTGFKVPLGTREEVVAGFRRILSMLVERRDVVEAVGERAHERAFRYFTWDAKSDQIVRIYDWVLGRGSKPDFGMPIGIGPQEPPVVERASRAAP